LEPVQGSAFLPKYCHSLLKKKHNVQDHLITPHGGTLINLLVNSERAAELKAESKHWTSWSLSPRQLCDLELLVNGAFSPLRGFMVKADYESICSSMRLLSGQIWPIPIVLDVSEEFARKVNSDEPITLRDPEGMMLGVLHVEDIWQPNHRAEAEAVYGTMNEEHPGVSYLFNQTQPVYIGGRVEGVQLPEHYDFKSLRLRPADLRAEFTRLGWRRIIAFQTRNPMHRAHFELTMKAIKEYESNLLIHPVVGLTKPGDVDHYTRVRCYMALLSHYPKYTVKVSLLNLAMRMAGPREAIFHAVIRKNHGCSHFIVGRDHAGPGNDSSGNPFYGPYEAQELLSKYQEELGITMVPFKMMIYLEEKDRYVPIDETKEEDRTLSISGTELRRRLSDGREIPKWFTFPEVARELRRTHPPRHRRGFTLFFTGLSGAGKSTLANAVMAKLLEAGGRPVTLLDGDIVRKNLSSELGFSKEHRDLNILRIGFVANEITKNGGIAICAPIAPYDFIRKEVRSLIAQYGGFILGYVATPLEVCEERDRKGLYAKARAGIIKEFTGISDPYEPPDDAEIVIDTSDLSPEEAAQDILLYLERAGYISGNYN
jgi:sulfate adenylyltransferase